MCTMIAVVFGIVSLSGHATDQDEEKRLLTVALDFLKDTNLAGTSELGVWRLDPSCLSEKELPRPGVIPAEKIFFVILPDRIFNVTSDGPFTPIASVPCHVESGRIKDCGDAETNFEDDVGAGIKGSNLETKTKLLDQGKTLVMEWPNKNPKKWFRVSIDEVKKIVFP